MNDRNPLCGALTNGGIINITASTPTCSACSVKVQVSVNDAAPVWAITGTLRRAAPTAIRRRFCRSVTVKDIGSADVRRQPNVCPISDLPVDKTSESVVIDQTAVERCDKRCVCAAQKLFTQFYHRIIYAGWRGAESVLFQFRVPACHGCNGAVSNGEKVIDSVETHRNPAGPVRT